MAFNFYLNFIFTFTFDFTNLKFNSLIGAVLKSNDLIEQIRKYGLQSAVLCLILHRQSPPGTFHIFLIGKFSYFVIRFLLNSSTYSKI